MNSRLVLETLLLAMTADGVNSVSVVWNSGSAGSPISDPVPPCLDIQSTSRHGHVSFYWHDGLDLLLEVLGTTKNDLNGYGHPYREYNRIIVARSGDKLSLTSVM